MKPATENMDDKQHRAVTRELVTRAVPLDTTGAPATSASFKGQVAISAAGNSYVAVTVGNGAADWKQTSGAVAALFTAVAQGEVPASGGGTVNFLRADGTWTTPVASNPRQYLGVATGTGPWSFSGLTGDASDVCGYELVFRFTKAAAAAYTVGLRLNADSGANYVNSGGGGNTEVAVITSLGLGSEVITGTVVIPVSASGAFRQAVVAINYYDGAPESLYSTEGWTWRNSANQLTAAAVSMISGTVDSGVVRLYALKDVA